VWFVCNTNRNAVRTITCVSGCTGASGEMGARGGLGVRGDGG
jgi:hypothetical protein